jgi:hypothetical protein
MEATSRRFFKKVILTSWRELNNGGVSFEEGAFYNSNGSDFGS